MIKVIVQGLHLEVTEALNSHVQEQVGKVVDNFESIIVEDIVVTLGVNNHHSHLNSVTIKVPVKGNDVVVDGTYDDMYKSITEVSQKASRLLRKTKDKMKSHKGKDKRLSQEIEEEEL